jgi:hypothetical protein
MDLTKIIAIAGYPGLFKIVAQASNGIIVESLIDKKRMTAYTHYKISGLEDISIFTYADDVPLKEVLMKIKELEKGEKCLDPKSEPAILREYLEKILPDFDKERVHNSDIKKLLTWYNLLLDNNLLIDADPVEESKDKKTEEQKADKPKKTVKAGAKPKSDTGSVKPTAARAPRKANTPRKTGS